MKRFSRKKALFSIMAGMVLIITLLNLVKTNVFYNLMFIPDVCTYALFSVIVVLSFAFGPVIGFIAGFSGILLGFLGYSFQWNPLYLFFGLVYSVLFAVFALCIGYSKIILEKKCKNSILLHVFMGLSLFIVSFVLCNILDQVGFQFYFEYSFNFGLGFAMFGITFNPIKIIGEICNDVIHKFSLMYWFHALVITVLSTALFLLYEKTIERFIEKRVNRKAETDVGGMANKSVHIKQRFIGLVLALVLLVVAGVVFWQVWQPGEASESAADTSAPVDTSIPVSGNMVLIEGGTFTMGSPESEADRYDDETQHSVTMSAFWMGEFEVTQWEYESVMGINPSYFKGVNLPVEKVSWYDAVDYCNRLSEREGLVPAYTIDKDRRDPDDTDEYDNKKWGVTLNQSANGYRLPTEAEWEYACRAGTTTPFNTGENITTEQANYNGNYPYNGNATGVYRGKTSAVGSFSANQWGLCDMHGNVMEWCWDWYDNYTSDSQTNLVDASSDDCRVFRGGSWYDNGGYMRSANRFPLPPWYRNDNVGFRLARSWSEVRGSK